jgi:magnesium transporter
MPTQTPSTTTSLVRDLTYKQKGRLELFQSLDVKEQSRTLLHLSKNIQSQLLSELKKDIVIPLIEQLDPDDATDLLQTLSKRKQKEILEDVGTELRSKISLLLQFDPQTAAGLMSLNYIQIDENESMETAARVIITHEKRTGRHPIVLGLRNGKLAGVIPMHAMIQAQPKNLVKDFIKKISSIKHTASSTAVINHFIDNPHRKVVVLGDNDAILGVIYSDDVLRVLRENTAANLYNFAGVNEEETVFGSVKQKVQSRYKWLIVNLATAFLASFTVGLFNETISKFVLLAVYMPIVAGMGGNSATQTLAVMVRGIALKQIELKTALPTLKKELGASIINGLINGVLVASVVLIFNRDVRLALVLAIAMTTNLLVAGFFGTLVPLIMEKLKKDPATSATIFITTATDVLGFLVFLGLGTLLLR